MTRLDEFDLNKIQTFPSCKRKKNENARTSRTKSKSQVTRQNQSNQIYEFSI